MVEGDTSTLQEIQAGVLQSSVLAPILYNLYINDTPHTSGGYLALFADDTYLYRTDRKEGYVLRELQRGLTSVQSWCERWNLKPNEDKTQTIYFFHRRRPVEAYLALKGRHIPFVNNVKHVDVILIEKLHAEYI
jgi:hypothetical protein